MSRVIHGWDRYQSSEPVAAGVFYRVSLEDQARLAWWRGLPKRIESFISFALPELLFIHGILPGRQNRIEDVLGICSRDVLWKTLSLLDILLAAGGYHHSIAILDK